jgi:hypothetical protein
MSLELSHWKSRYLSVQMRKYVHFHVFGNWISGSGTIKPVAAQPAIIRFTKHKQLLL